jgi:thioester reductase-like protein
MNVPVSSNHKRELDARSLSSEPIAIIGVGCRLPGGVKSPNDFWRLLCNKVDAIEEIPSSRWDQFKFYDNEPGRQGKIITKWGGFIENVDQFDPAFFGISPREAASMDPQQRLVLESAWEALEDAGQQAEALSGQHVGVFVGVSTFDYGLMQNTFSDVSGAGPYTNTGQALSICANRLSYVMNWKGPSFIVDTACSSSLLACHMAINSIRSGESSMAVVAGVNFICAPSTYVGFTAMGMLSPDGRCRAFDSTANGFVRAEGGCSVVLKPLRQALCDGDTIYALLAGSACNQDGHTPGLTMPSQQSQEALVREACRSANIHPNQIRYVEAHGTGTPVGDPIETNALGAVLGQERPSDQVCWIGSVKANIGHLEAGSGIAGLIKAALILKHGQIPPNIHFTNPNPSIDFPGLGLKVPTEITELPGSGDPAYVGVNSFGFGGTNVHVILQEHLSPPSNGKAPGNGKIRISTSTPLELSKDANVDRPFKNDRLWLIPISARSPESVQQMASTYASALADDGIWASASMEDIAYTTVHRRSHHSFRAAIVAKDKEELKVELEQLAMDESQRWLIADRVQPSQRPLAFVFSGQGPQWWAMGRMLMEESPVFRQTLERCDRIVRQLGSWSLLEELQRSEDTTRINETTYAQPAIFAVQVGLLELYKSWGIHPDFVVGHSVGEVAAAYAAGVLSFDDAVKVIYHRGRTMGVVKESGAMLAVSMTVAQAEDYLRMWSDKVNLAAINGPSTVTLSGESETIAQMESDLQAKGIFARRLLVNYAFHSYQMDPVQADLIASLADVQSRPASIPMVSTVTGKIVEGSELGAEYWWHNVRQSVQFVQAMDVAMQREYSLFLEISPHPVLAGAIGESYVGRGKQAQVITSLRRNEPELPTLMRSLGMLYSLHCPVDWSVLAPHGHFLKFPAYPWQKQSYWSESDDSRVSRLPCLGHPILGARLPGSRLVYQGFIDVRAQPFAMDHKIQGHVLMPGTGFVEMGLALGKEIYGEGNFVLSDVELLKAAFMPEKETLMTQTLLDSRTGRYFIETQPLGQPHRPWTVHSVGVLRERPPIASEIRPTLSEVKRRCNNSLPANVFYDFFRRCGFPFGPSFRGLTHIRLGIGEMLGVVEVPSECEADFDKYLFHPAVLDACLQGNFGCFMTHNRSGNNLGDMEDRIRKAEIFMPSGYDEIRLYRPPAKRMWTYVRMHERFKDQTSSDIFIFDDEGELIAEVRGFKETLVGNVEGNAESGSGLLYEYEWKLQPSPGLSERRFSMPALDEAIQQASESNWFEALQPRLARESEIRTELDPICAAFVYEAFAELGMNQLPTCDLDKIELINKLGIPAERHKLAIHLLHRLICTASQGKLPSNPVNRLRDLFWSYPEAYPQLSLLARCAKDLPKVLIGNLEPLSDSDFGNLIEVQDSIWASSPLKGLQIAEVAELVGRLVQEITPGHPARILDLRGAAGRLASSILQRLPNEIVDYVFCDSDDKEFSRIGESLAKGNQVKFQKVDLNSESLVPEGETLPKCEVIIAHEALTGRTDQQEILNRLYQHLVPGGVLIILEKTVRDWAHELTLGLPSLCNEGELPSSDQWSTYLLAAGFDTPRCIENRTSSIRLSHSIIAAPRPSESQLKSTEPTSSEATGVVGDDVVDASSTTTKELWLVFADSSPKTDQLMEIIAIQGVTPLCIEPGESFARASENRYIVNPASVEDYRKLLQCLGPERPKQVLYLWSQRVPNLDSAPSALVDSRTYCALAPLLFCQAWTHVCAATPTGLWLISQRAQAISSELSTIAIGQTPLWGTGRVVMLEFPHLKCKLVDLGSANEAELEHLLAEISNASPEDEIAFRDEARYVHRFVASSLSKYADRGEEPGEPYRLHLSEYGTLDGMRLRPAELREPLDLPTLVEIEVHAAALNFSDVMKALALYPGLPEGFVPVGIECAGVITKVGDEVKDFKPGDEVICITPMAISSHTYTDHRFVAHKPKHLSMAAAATLPIAYLTAHYALNYIGRMEKDEKVLVNAATGGVGLAAIQLSQSAGAELFATAGTSEKRSLLEFLGVEHIMNSRTLVFADEVMEKTKHRGVDLILNSLSGEAIGKGMSILADYGRFLEIGKRDIYGNTPLGLRAFRKNVSFAAIDLDRGLREKPDLCSKMFRQIVTDAESKQIAALPHRVFPVTQLVDAFRYMAKAKHIGKVVLEMKGYNVRPVRDTNTTSIKFRPDASYLVTGGLGGLGSQLATWMVDLGAKCLVLASRRGVATEEGQQLVRSLEERGVKVVIEKVDLSNEAEVQSLIERIGRDLLPLRGIMHGAVVLDDGLILHLNEERIERVCGPKMNAAWYLHEATKAIELDFFVCHSSTSSALGNAGQANYAAANAFLDGLAHYRRSMGLPAFTINWGYLGELGVAAANKKLAEKFEQQGVRSVPPSEGLPILSKLMAFPIDQMSVMRVDWVRLRQIAPMMTQSPRFAQMMLASSSGDESKSQSGSAIRNLILATDPENRIEVMLEIVREKVARVLGTRSEKIVVDRSLMDMGLDSLMGFELRNWIEGELRINVPVVELMQGPTVQKLTTLILAQLEKGETSASPTSSESFTDHLSLLNTDPEKAKVLAELVTMADDVRGELQSSDESINLANEIGMPPDMFGSEFGESLLAGEMNKPVQRVFMTGATGFLGAYVMHHLLERNPELQVLSLVRASNEKDGLARIHENLAKYELWNPAFGERVQIVLGDVSQPRFGLDVETHDHLANEVDIVLHNAAGVNFLQSYSQLKPINVAGTLNALRFASYGRIKPYHHISTLFTFSILDHLQLSTIKESDNPARHELIFGGYLQSKWVADNLVQQARAKGLPVTIYRPGIVTGDSRTGACSNDIISRALASAIQLGCTPADDMRFPFTPVDYVGQAIAALLLSDESTNRNFHLVNRDLVTWPTVIGWLKEQGYPVELLPYKLWLERLKQSSSESDGTMLSALLPLIPEVQLSERAEGLDPPSFDCSLSEQALEKLGIVCPAISAELISTYVEYLTNSGSISSHAST